MSPALEKGIAAAKAGNKKEALRFLREALLLDAQNANAWLWMSAMVDDPEKQRHCLKMVLEIEPDNKAARNGLAELNQNFPPTVLPVPSAPEEPSQSHSAASDVPSQPLVASLATSQSLSPDSGSASEAVPSRPVSASAPVSSTPIPAAAEVPSRPVPASTPVSSKPVSPFTTPEITPDDPALTKTQAILVEGAKPIQPVSKPAFLPDEETGSNTDPYGSTVSQSANRSLAGKRKVERAARDRRWQIIILILLALIIIGTIVVIGMIVYPRIMNGNLSNLIPQFGGLPTIQVPNLLSGITQPKQTPLPLPAQLGVFLLEGGNYITLTPGNGRPPKVDVPTTTNKLPVILFYDPSIDPGHVKLFDVTSGILGSEVIINLDQNQGIITSTIQNPLDTGFYCFVQSKSTLKPADQNWWCFNEGSTDDTVDTSINIGPPASGFYIIQNGTPVVLKISSEVISSAGSNLPMISPSRPIVIADVTGVTPDTVKLVALVGGFGIQLSVTDSSILKIYPGSPAEITGLETGDIILSVDGQETNKDFSTTERLIEAPYGSIAKLYIQRGNHQVTLTVTRSWVVDTTDLAFNVVPKPGFFYLVPMTSLSPGAYCYESSKSSWCFGVQQVL
jgi:hypothetical protein